MNQSIQKNQFLFWFSLPFFVCTALSLLAGPASARILWEDSYESASFSGGGWANSGAALTSGTSAAGAWCAVLNGTDIIIKNFSLAGLTRITVRYARSTVGMGPTDSLFSEWYDGKKWNLIEDATNSDGWRRKSFRLPAAASCNRFFQLRFRVQQGTPSAYALVDGVAIEGISLVPVSVTQLNDIENGFALKGRDGGYSFALDGRFAMMFGDSVLSQQNSEGISWVVNTMYHTSDFNPDDGPSSGGLSGGYNFRLPNQPANQWIPCTPAEKAFNDGPSSGTAALWPGAAFWDPLTKKHYIFTMKLIEYPGIWPTNVGMGISRIDGLSTHPVRLVCRPGEAEDTILFPFEQNGYTGYGNMALVEGNYIYAYYGKGESWGDLRVARAPLTGFLDRGQWRFWDGMAWNTSMAVAAIITQAAPMGTIHWNAHLDAYLLVYMQVLGDQVKLRVADRPEGPWSDAAIAFKAERGANDALPYGGLAHQALQRNGGWAEYITYNLPGTWATGSRVPLVRIRFESLSSTLAATHWERY